MSFSTFSRYFLLFSFGIFCVINLIDQQDKILPLLQKTDSRIVALKEKKVPVGEYEKKISAVIENVYDPLNAFFFWRFKPLQRDAEILHDVTALKYANAVHIQQKQEKMAFYQSKGIPNPILSTGKLIVVDIPAQRLYAYEDGISIFENPVSIVSGKSGYETVTGTYAAYDKKTPFRMLSPFTSEYYDSTVTYWLPFFKDYGIHDAYWRSRYGEPDYPSTGTHGCVNVPFPEMKKLFEWTDIGTTVVVK